MDIGRKIYEIRKREGMSQSEFADKFNVTRQTVSHWENGRNYPDMGTLMRISEEYDVSFDELIKQDHDLMRTIDKNRRFFSWSGIILGILWLVVISTIIIKFTPLIVSQFYYDPNDITSDDSEKHEVAAGIGYESETTRLEKDTRVYSELFLPEKRFEYAEAISRGFGKYDITLAIASDEGSSADHIIAGRIERDRLQLYEPEKYSRPDPDYFDRSDVQNPSDGKSLGDTESLNESHVYVGYITFNDNMKYQDTVDWIEQYNVNHPWAYIETEDNDNVDILGLYMDKDDSDAQKHFIDLLRYFLDNPTYLEMVWGNTDDMMGRPVSQWLPDKIQYIDNNGLIVRGLAVEADKETLLELSNDTCVYRIVTEETIK